MLAKQASGGSIWKGANGGVVCEDIRQARKMSRSEAVELSRSPAKDAGAGGGGQMGGEGLGGAVPDLVFGPQAADRPV